MLRCGRAGVNHDAFVDQQEIAGRDLQDRETSSTYQEHVRHDHAPIRHSGDPVGVDSVDVTAEFATMAANIGELERIADDPSIGEGAEPLRALARRLRSTMEDQFDCTTAQTSVFPWWAARCRDRAGAAPRP